MTGVGLERWPDDPADFPRSGSHLEQSWGKPGEHQERWGLPKEGRGTINNLHFFQEPGVHRNRRAWLDGGEGAEAGGSRAGVGAEAARRVQGMSHSLRATLSHTLGRASLGLPVDQHQAGRGGNRSPSLCAWPKATGSRLPLEQADRGSIGCLRWAILGSRVCSFKKQDGFLRRCVFHMQVGGFGDKIKCQSGCCDFWSKSV